jgi:elongation factor P
MITTNDLKVGLAIEYDGDLLEIVEWAHIKPGKGPAFVRAKLRNLRTGAIFERTFRAGEKVQDVRIEEKEVQFLYSAGDEYVFMDGETFEQISVPKAKVGRAAGFIKENDNVKIALNGDEVLGITLPIHVVLRIARAEPGVRGNTASTATKPATLETGAVINVPLFVEEGDRVKIDTRTGEYVERAK